MQGFCSRQDKQGRRTGLISMKPVECAIFASHSSRSLSIGVRMAKVDNGRH